MPPEYKNNQELIRRHYLAYSLGAYSNTCNGYRHGTKDWLAFNLGRDWKMRSDKSNPLLLRRQKG